MHLPAMAFAVAAHPRSLFKHTRYTQLVSSWSGKAEPFRSARRSFHTEFGSHLTRLHHTPLFSRKIVLLSNMRADVRDALPRDAHMAVVGLGAAGIATVLELRAAGFSNITVFEATPNAGGTWVYSSNTKNAQSSMYKSLHCNIPKVSMCYVDRPFQERARSFASHSDVAEYLQTIVADEGILPLVRFSSPVARVAPTDPDNFFTSWAVQTFVSPSTAKPVGDENQEARINSSGTQAVHSSVTHNSNLSETPRMLSDVEIFDAVILCNGHYTGMYSVFETRDNGCARLCSALTLDTSGLHT